MMAGVAEMALGDGRGGREMALGGGRSSREMALGGRRGWQRDGPGRWQGHYMHHLSELHLLKCRINKNIHNFTEQH